MATVLHKTPKGLAEVETRVHRLGPRQRSLLILVDGRRSAADLAQMLGRDVGAELQTLLDGAFIEAVAAIATSGAPAPVPLPPLRTARVVAPAVAAAAEASTDLARLQRDAARVLNDLLGPAADALAIRMERARDSDEFQLLLGTAESLIATARGAQAAAAFRARFVGR